MLIKKDSYKRNKNTGEIIQRQIVLIRCDDCGFEWETLFENRKRKKLKRDLCKSCRGKFSLKSQTSLSKRRWSQIDSRINIVCSLCQKDIKKHPSQIHKNGNNFCGNKCKNDYKLQKYDILYETFKKNLDETAYLFGLILGDGYLRKMSKNTTRVDIAFNSKEKNMIILAQNIMSKLKIIFYEQKDKNHNCLHLGFIFPDNLLNKYNMLWEESKFKVNPYPNKKIINNINMVVGLINSDGHCMKRNGEVKYIRFSNTVESIFRSFIECLNFHNIFYSKSVIKGRIDNRTGNMSKDSFRVGLGIESVNKIFSLKKYILKGEVDVM